MKLSEKIVEAIKSERHLDAIKMIRSDHGMSLSEATRIVDSFDHDTSEVSLKIREDSTKIGVTAIEKLVAVLFIISIPCIFISDASNWSWVLFATTLSLFGVSVFKVNFFSISEAHRSLGWPTVLAIVEKTQVHKSRNSEGGSLYTPFLTYIYEVEGEKYEGNRISFGTYSGTRGYAQKVLSEVDKIDPLRVYYDPYNHRNSVIIPGVKIIQFSGVLVGIGMIAAGSLGNYVIYIGLP